MINLFYTFQELIPVKVNIKERENGDFLIVMNEFLEIQYLNETAKFIYSNFNGKNTVKDIFHILIKEYEIEDSMTDEVQKDIINTIRDFQWQKIAKLKK